MGETTVKLTVFFEEPFWVGVFERTENGKLSAAKVTFGAEPKEQEVWELVLKKYCRMKFSPAVEAAAKLVRKSHKAARREAKRQMGRTGVGTKSQQALQLQREQRKTEQRLISREKREAEKQRLFELKQQKRKTKHKGH